MLKPVHTVLLVRQDLPAPESTMDLLSDTLPIQYGTDCIVLGQQDGTPVHKLEYLWHSYSMPEFCISVTH
jgi:hypothetical protein